MFAILLVLVCAAAVALAWNTRQRLRGLEQELVKRQQASQDQSVEARMLSKQAQDSARDSAAKVALLEARVAEVALQRGQLEDVIQQLSRSLDDSAVVDIDSAVRVATQQAAITGSAEPLIAALRQADDRIARSGQPRLDGVRRAIARDLDRARSAGSVNIASLSMKLDETVRMIDELPLLSVADRNAPPGSGPSPVSPAPALPTSGAASRASPRSAPQVAGAASEPWYRGTVDAWNTVAGLVWNEARSLVRVTRIDHPDAMLMSPDNAFFLRENLKLRLLNARLAVLSRQFDSARSDLQHVQSALDRYFDQNSRKVTVAAEMVRQVSAQAQQVSLPRPDDTLAALTAAAAGR